MTWTLLNLLSEVDHAIEYQEAETYTEYDKGRLDALKESRRRILQLINLNAEEVEQ